MARWALWSLGFLLVACAEKRYVGGSNDGLNRQKTALTCDHRLQPSQNCLSLIWEKAATEKLSGAFIFKVWRPNKGDQTPVPLEAGDAEVVLWMPHMGGGHGSSPVAVEKLDLGTYRARRVFFSMPGVWEIRFSFHQGGVVDQVTLPFQFAP